MKISIAIPTYECYGNGWIFMSELLNSIKKQSYENYEVIISDQSTDDKIKKLIDFYSNEMEIKYLNSKNIERKIGSNLNNALKYCSGDIIKPMMADDFFIDNNSFEKIVNNFKTYNTKWLVTSCEHCYSINFMINRMIPRYNDKIHLGDNTISSPSVLAMKDINFFDENLSHLIDCEMYKRLYTLHGNPQIILDPLICNRMHDKQMGKILNIVDKSKEQEYCIKLYGE